MKRYFLLRGWILAAFCLFAILGRHYFERQHQNWAWLLIVIGLGLRLHCGRFIGSHSNGDTVTVVLLSQNGPYHYSRHPLYLSNMISIVGLILWANPFAPIFNLCLCLAIFFHHEILIRHEEDYLLSQDHLNYQNYRSQVFRWLGRAQNKSTSLQLQSLSIFETRNDLLLNTNYSWKQAFQFQAPNLFKTLITALLLSF